MLPVTVAGRVSLTAPKCGHGPQPTFQSGAIAPGAREHRSGVIADQMPAIPVRGLIELSRFSHRGGFLLDGEPTGASGECDRPPSIHGHRIGRRLSYGRPATCGSAPSCWNGSGP